MLPSLPLHRFLSPYAQGLHNDWQLPKLTTHQTDWNLVLKYPSPLSSLDYFYWSFKMLLTYHLLQEAFSDLSPPQLSNCMIPPMCFNSTQDCILQQPVLFVCLFPFLTSWGILWWQKVCFTVFPVFHKHGDEVLKKKVLLNENGMNDFRQIFKEYWKGWCIMVISGVLSTKLKMCVAQKQ